MKRLCRHNLDAFVAVEIEEIHILGDNKPGASGSRRREELVVFRIATHRWDCHGLHNDGGGNQIQHRGEVAGIDITILADNRRPTKHVQIFVHDRRGHDPLIATGLLEQDPSPAAARVD